MKTLQNIETSSLHWADPLLWETKPAVELVVPNEIEVSTAELWLDKDTIRVTSIGSENTYYIDEFNNTFFCKNYPDNDLVGYGEVYAPSSTYQ